MAQRRKDGVAIEAEMVSFRMQFARQQARVVIARDVTRRKHTHEAMWRDLDGSAMPRRRPTMPCSTGTVTNDQLWRSDNYVAVLGRGADEPSSTWHLWFEHVHPEDRARVQELLLSTIKSASSQWSDEFPAGARRP